MTKEELKQKAEEYASGKCKECYMCNSEENGERSYCPKLESRKEGYIAGADPREKRIAELEAQIEKMKSQYDYAFTQLLESREIVCLMLSQYRNKKEINYSTRERGEKLLKQGVYKHD